MKVFVPDTDYLLAMKILASRADTSDLDDIRFLITDLQLKNVDEALEIVRNYYPNKEIKHETIFLLEEIFRE